MNVLKAHLSLAVSDIDGSVCAPKSLSAEDAPLAKKSECC